jgi:hypothetical protein
MTVWGFSVIASQRIARMRAGGVMLVIAIGAKPGSLAN